MVKVDLENMVWPVTTSVILKVPFILDALVCAEKTAT